MSLRTDNVTIARVRAADLSPNTAKDEAKWLEWLVAIGEKARMELMRRSIAQTLSFDSIYEKFKAATWPPVPSASDGAYRRWTELLAETAKNLDIDKPPAVLSCEDAGRIAASLRATHLSAGRILRFYRRMWKTLVPGNNIWTSTAPCPGAKACKKTTEFYRRLSVDEVRRLVGHLQRQADSGTASVLADMVAIGFCTGLRLSDVAELERSEISPDGAFLHVLPNKVRFRKPNPLTIPLVPEMRKRIQARLAVIGPEECFLFPKKMRTRPSRRIAAAFRACGIVRQGCGRASFHSLRATFISLMDEAGVPPHITDAITGHGGGGMHARYTQPSAAALAQAVEKAIPPLSL